MASLRTKVELYLKANSKTWENEKDNITLQNDGSGDYIRTWNVSGLAKPTNEQLASYETAANTEESNNNVKATRKAAYGNIADQLDEIYKDIDAWKVSGLAKPSDSQIASYETAGNTAESNSAIDRARRSQYGSWESQMEMIYKDQKNGTSTFKDHCDKVRSDNPKE